MGPYLKQQRVGYAQIILIVVTEKPSLGVALRLIPQFAGDSTMQGGEVKGGVDDDIHSEMSKIKP